MATHCHNCHKAADVGNNVSHAKNRTKRLRKPNLHRSHIISNGTRLSISLCTKCLRARKKSQVAAVKA